MDHERIQIELGDRMITLQVLEFDTDVNVDDILKIDYNNLTGEIITFPSLFNRIANLKAEIDMIVKEISFDLDVFSAQLKDQKRSEISARSGKATVDAVESAVTQDPAYILKKKFLIKRQRDAQYLENLYWTAQAKTGLLQKLSEKIRPEEFMGELLEDTINGVMIKANKKLIK